MVEIMSSSSESEMNLRRGKKKEEKSVHILVMVFKIQFFHIPLET